MVAAGIGFALHGIGQGVAAPESWTGIYRGTVFVSDIERESIAVEIKETDVRKIELEIRRTKNDAAFLTVGEAELALEKSSVLAFTAQTGSAVPAEERGSVFVELQYIDENTIEMKYGYTQEELEDCDAVRLTRSVE